MISATQRIQPDCGYHKQVYTCNTESYSLTTLWCCIEKTIFLFLFIWGSRRIVKNQGQDSHSVPS